MNLKNRNKIAKITDEAFYDLFNQGKTWSDIARALNVSVGAVSTYAKRRGISSNFVYGNPAKIELIRNLHSEGFNDTQIAAKVSMSNSNVHDIRSRVLNLPVNQKNCRITMTDKQRAIIIGGLLGDSYMTANSVGVNGGFAHSLAQKEYFMWKYHELENLCGVITESSQIHTKTKKEYFKIYTSFYSTRELKVIADAFYLNRQKTLPNCQYIWDNFTEHSLAVWFGDDGSRHSIATMSFDLEKIMLLIQLLEEKYQIPDLTVDKTNSIILRRSSLRAIADICIPILPSSMHYKLSWNK